MRFSKIKRLAGCPRNLGPAEMMMVRAAILITVSLQGKHRYDKVEELWSSMFFAGRSNCFQVSVNMVNLTFQLKMDYRTVVMAGHFHFSETERKNLLHLQVVDYDKHKKH